MNKLITSCALVATASKAIQIEANAEEYVEINIGAPTNWEDDDEAFVEINVGDEDAVDLEYDDAMSDEKASEEEMMDEDEAEADSMEDEENMEEDDDL